MRERPICGTGYAGHRVVLLANTRLGDRYQGSLGRFFRAPDQRAGRKMHGFQEWQAQGQNAGVFFLPCVGGDFSAIVVCTPFGSPYSHSIERPECVAKEYAGEPEALVPPEQWERVKTVRPASAD